LKIIVFPPCGLNRLSVFAPMNGAYTRLYTEGEKVFGNLQVDICLCPHGNLTPASYVGGRRWKYHCDPDMSLPGREQLRLSDWSYRSSAFAESWRTVVWLGIRDKVPGDLIFSCQSASVWVCTPP